MFLTVTIVFEELKTRSCEKRPRVVIGVAKLECDCVKKDPRDLGLTCRDLTPTYFSRRLLKFHQFLQASISLDFFVRGGLLLRGA